MPRPRTTSGSSIDDATYSGRCKTFPKSCSACKEAMQVQRCGDDGGTKVGTSPRRHDFQKLN
ncbi:hypothetical protein FVEN_g12710 [Fusarium venenatum]|nr:hypothetical protein FVEN_g12710 [Fusarium venenatum]